MTNAIARSECVFCKIADGGQRVFRGQFPQLDRREVMFRSSSFCIIPDISPIRFGHALIIPNVHLESASILSPAMNTELDEVRRLFTDFCESEFGLDCLEFEHGSAGLKACGGCINHAHIHMVPIEASLWGEIEMAAGRLTPSLSSDVDLTSVEYLVARFRGMELAWNPLFQRSQFFRRILSELLHKPSRASWLGFISGPDMEIAEAEVSLLMSSWDRFMAQRTSS